MLPIFRDAPAVKNVIAGQNATCDYDVGWNYYALRFVATVTTSSTSAATEALLSDALGQIVLNVNGDPKVTVQAYELNAIQTAWTANIAATLYSKTANDLITSVADTTASPYQRTSTWVLDVWLAEPSRDSYSARKAFSWPTAWNNKAVGAYPANYTANIQAVISVRLLNRVLCGEVVEGWLDRGLLAGVLLDLSVSRVRGRGPVGGNDGIIDLAARCVVLRVQRIELLLECRGLRLQRRPAAEVVFSIAGETAHCVCYPVHGA